MTIRFTPVLSSYLTDPPGRFPPPQPDDRFAWWKLAVPSPVYWGCIVQITKITSADLVSVKFFARDATLLPTEVEIDLRDRNQAWRGLPSTIASTLEPLPATVGELGTQTCAVLCVSTALLDKEHLTGKVEFIKYPYTEELVDENAALRTMVTNQAIALLKARNAGLQLQVDELTAALRERDPRLLDRLPVYQVIGKHLAALDEVIP